MIFLSNIPLRILIILILFFSLCFQSDSIDLEEEDLSQLDTAGLDILTEDYGPEASSFQKEYEESHKKDELRK